MWKINQWKLFAVVGLACAGGSFRTLAATGNPWFDLFDAYNDNRGGSYVGWSDAAILAWQESYILRAYLNMYELTGDTDWLDDFVTHADTVLGHAADADGDGYLDWTTGQYSPDDVVNGGFETADAGDATLPDGWTRNGSTASTVFLTNANDEFFSGGTCSTNGWGLEVTTNAGTLQRIYQVIASYEVGQLYALSVRARKDSGASVNGRVFVYDRTDNAVLANLEIDRTYWRYYVDSFTMPAAGHTVEVWITHYSDSPSGQTVWFDEARVAPQYAYQVLDGMIGIPLARFVRLVDQNPGSLSAYQTDADGYQTFLEDEVVAKWSDSGSTYGDTWYDVSGTKGYYREPTSFDTFSTGITLDPLPHNQYGALLNLQNILYDVNGDSDYLDRVEAGAAYFEDALTLETNGSYTWDYSDLSGSKVEDTSHGNIDLEWIRDLYLAGTVYDASDMVAFTSTLVDNLWDTSGSTPALHNHVDGTAGGYCNDGRFSKYMWGWMPLAQFDEQVWTIASAQYDGLTYDELSATFALTLTEIMKWDPVKLVNQGFEYISATDSTLPARWNRLLSSSTTAYLDASNASSGAYGLTLVSNGSQWQKLEQPWGAYVASETYRVTFDGMVDGGGADGRVWIYNADTSTTVAAYNFDNTTWQSHTFTFVAPSTAGQDLRIHLGHQDYTVAGSETSFDNVSIRVDGDTW